MTTTCDADCGKTAGNWETSADGFATYGDGDILRVFCTPACRDAGRPTHPTGTTRGGDK